jgi:hypothetical protein
MEVTFKFEHPCEFVELMAALTKSSLVREKTGCCEIDTGPRFIDGEGNIYTSDEMNDFLIDSDGIGAP